MRERRWRRNGGDDQMEKEEKSMCAGEGGGEGFLKPDEIEKKTLKSGDEREKAVRKRREKQVEVVGIKRRRRRE